MNSSSWPVPSSICLYWETCWGVMMVVYIINLRTFQGATSEMPVLIFSLSDPFLFSLSVLSLGNFIWIHSFNYHPSAYEYQFYMSSSCLSSALQNNSTIAYLMSLLVNIKGIANMLIQTRRHRLPIPAPTPPYLLPFQCLYICKKLSSFLCPGLRSLPWQIPLFHTPCHQNYCYCLLIFPNLCTSPWSNLPHVWPGQLWRSLHSSFLTVFHTAARVISLLEQLTKSLVWVHLASPALFYVTLTLCSSPTGLLSVL